MRKLKTKTILVLSAVAIIGIAVVMMNVMANRMSSTFIHDNQTALARGIHEGILRHVKENAFNGTVLVAKEGEIIFNEGYGYARRFLGKKQNLPDTKFVLGSMSKSFTAVAMLALVESNQASLDDPVAMYYPAYQEWRDVKIRHLLNHTSGIVNYYRSALDYVKYFLFAQTPERIIAGVKNVPLLYKAGEAYNYSNTNYMILSGIIEKVSGKPYIDYLAESVIKPMGLTRTGYEPYPYKQENIAKGYCANMIVEVNGFNLSNFYGAGGLYSSTEDVFVFLQGVDENKLLNEEANAQVAGGYEYGYGLMLEDTQDYGRIYFHTGGGPGISTGMYHYADKGIIVVILGNNMACFTDQLSNDLVDILVGVDG